MDQYVPKTCMMSEWNCCIDFVDTNIIAILLSSGQTVCFKEILILEGEYVHLISLLIYALLLGS